MANRTHSKNISVDTPGDLHTAVPVMHAEAGSHADSNSSLLHNGSPESKSQKWYELLRDIPDIGRHTINLVLALVSVWLVHSVLEYFLGKEAKFFDWIPIRYVTDFADLVLIAKFIWHLIRNFNK
jgi:hypothetical protein